MRRHFNSFDVSRNQKQCVSEIFPGAIVEISFAKPIDKNNHNQLAKVKLINQSAAFCTNKLQNLRHDLNFTPLWFDFEGK